MIFCIWKRFQLLTLIFVFSFCVFGQTPTSKKTYTVEEFAVKFAEIKQQGWIQTKRNGTTGIGQTLEQLLGLTENNFAAPDLGEIELKTHRIGSKSMVTLFTFDRDAWKTEPLTAIRKYGTKDADGRLGLYFTMSKTPNSQGIYLKIEPDTLSVCHKDGTILLAWKFVELLQRFQQKFPALILVRARNEKRDGTEFFKYESAVFLKDSTADIFRRQIEKETVLIDLRLHDNETSARNHGTAFRIRQENLPLLFKTVKEL
jgi:hypothetical protein